MLVPIETDSAQVRFPPPLVYLGFLLLGLAIGAAIGRPRLGLGVELRLALGLLMVGLGLALVIAAGGLFRRKGTALEPWRPSTLVIDTGVYRWTRNPMYLGMAIAYAGAAVGLNSLVALALLPVALFAIQTQVIAREERYLKAKFGAAYHDYKRKVRRWV